MQRLTDLAISHNFFLLFLNTRITNLILLSVILKCSSIDTSEMSIIFNTLQYDFRSLKIKTTLFLKGKNS